MPALSESAATLRFSGDDLDPEELTRLLGMAPTRARKKGDVVHAGSKRERIERTGAWHLCAAKRRPGDIDEQVAEILAPLTQDLEIWRRLTARFRTDLFCGLFMRESDEGLTLSVTSLELLAARGIKVGLCLYGPSTAADDVLGDESE